MTPREELEALRRLAELEAKAAGAEAKPAVETKAAPTGPRLRSGLPAQSPLKELRALLGPTIEAVPAALGGIAGATLGPAGMVAGAGLGYGAGRQITRLMDVASGEQPAPTAGQAMLSGVEDVLTGATMEAGGNVAGRVIGKLAAPVAEKVGKAFTGSEERARTILRQALGQNVGQARQALQAQPGMTAGEAVADVNAPAFQALYQRAVVERDPAFARALALAQRGRGERAIGAMAGGGTQTAARGARGQAAQELTALTTPLREEALKAANTGGLKLKPLDINPIVQSIDTALETPGLRASNDLTRVLSLVKDDLVSLAERGGGKIDANDLYTIRKEGIAQRVRDVVKQDDPKAGAKLTASVLDRLRPLIDDAIEKAGGTGWRNYLKTYSEGMDEIARKEMAAEALQMFRDRPLEYVKLVRGNNTDAVEAAFGPGRFDIFKEMAKEMPTLDKVAKSVERGAAMTEQANLGQQALLEIFKQNRQLFRVPWGLSPSGALLNRALAEAEEKVGEKTMARLTAAMRSGEGTEKLINKLSAAERREIVRAMREAGQDTLIPKGAKGAAVNQLLPEGERENRNALNQ